MKKNTLQRFATWYTYAFAAYMGVIALPRIFGYALYSPLNTYWVIIPVWIIGVVLFWFARIKWYIKSLIFFLWIPFTFLGVFLSLGAHLEFDRQCPSGLDVYNSTTFFSSYDRYINTNIYIKLITTHSYRSFLDSEECRGE